MSEQIPSLEGRLNIKFDPVIGCYIVPMATYLYELQGRKLCETCHSTAAIGVWTKHVNSGGDPETAPVSIRVGQFEASLRMFFKDGKLTRAEDAQGRRIVEGDVLPEFREWQVKNCDECRAANT